MRTLARRRADPDRSVGKVLLLPDRGTRLQLLDRVARGVECGAAVGGGRGDDDARLAHRHSPDAVDDRQATDVKSFGDLLADRAQHVERHLLERLVVEAGHSLSGMPRGLCLFAGRRGARRLARLANEDDQRPVRVSRDGRAQLGEQLVLERVLADLATQQLFVLRACCASGHWRDQRQLVAVGELLVGRSVIPVERKPDR